MTSEESAEIRRLKREVAELRRPLEIVKAASSFFAAELCATRRRSDRVGWEIFAVDMAVTAAG